MCGCLCDRLRRSSRAMTKNKLPTTNGNSTTGLLSDVINGIDRAQCGTSDHGIEPSRSQDPLGHLIRFTDHDYVGTAEMGSATGQHGSRPVHDRCPRARRGQADRPPCHDRQTLNGRRTEMDPTHSVTRLEGTSAIGETASHSRRTTYLSVRQAAWLLGVPTSVVHRAIRVGTLRAVRRRSRLVVTENDVRRLMPSDAA